MYTDNTFIFNGVLLNRLFVAEKVIRPVGARKRFTQSPIAQGAAINAFGYEAGPIKVAGNLLGETLQEVLQARIELTRILTEPAGEVRISFPDDLGLLMYSGFYIGGCEITSNDVNPELTLQFFIPRLIAYGAQHSTEIDANGAQLAIGGTQPTYPIFTLTVHSSGVTKIGKHHNGALTQCLNVHTDSAGVIVIDCEQESVTHTGGGKAYVDLASDFFTLEAGDKVVPSITAPDKLIVEWEDRYV